MIGSTLFIKDSSFTLSVTGIDQYGNESTTTAMPTFKKWRRWSSN